MMTCLERGSLRRTTSSTLMNETSSRSHAIITIFIEQHKISDLYNKDYNKNELNEKLNEEDDGFITAKIHIVDLAVNFFFIEEKRYFFTRIIHS